MANTRMPMLKARWAAGPIALLIALAGCVAEPEGNSPTPPLTPIAGVAPTHTPILTTTLAAADPLVQHQLTVNRVRQTLPDYDRDTWRHWVDADGDCQDTRQEVLIAESKVSVTFETSKQCRVGSGRWTGPYTGTVVDDPSKLDVDHMVPLANAHRSGGWAWSPEQKAAFANHLEYEDHLIATTASANRSKGSDGPEDWRPPDQGYWCDYAVDWITIKSRWGLTATEREWKALREMLDTCDKPVQVEVTYHEGLPTTPPPTAITGSQGLKYDPGGPDRDCGDFGTWQEAQTFYEAAGGPERDLHRLDPDGDGIACESLPGSP